MIGKRLKQYEVESQLGQGGMGVVYRARDTRLDRPVALKVLMSELTGDPERQQRFLREARAAAAVTHPAIAQIYDVDEADGITFIAMELVEGQTVRKLIEGRDLDLQSAVDIALQVSEGLARAHEAGIVHRDIKSDNIMVTRDGHAKILDFGLAKLLDPEPGSVDQDSARETLTKTRAGVVLGTISYMSPEQARGRAVDPRSDIFSLGIVLYEMVTGELPFHGASALDTLHAIAYEEIRPVTVVRKNLPGDVHRVVSRCLRKRPEDRYPSSESLAADLKILKRDIESGIQPRRISGTGMQSAAEWLRSSLPQAWAGVLLGVATLVVVGYLFYQPDAIGAFISIALVSLVVFRLVRNRRRRLARGFVSRISKIKDVIAVRVADDLITVIVGEAKAKVFVRVNTLLEDMNNKHFLGEPFRAEVRDDLSHEDLQRILRSPGIAYVRKDILDA
jgi:serine/threonine protein kinase